MSTFFGDMYKLIIRCQVPAPFGIDSPVFLAFVGKILLVGVNISLGSCWSGHRILGAFCGWTIESAFL